MSFKDPEGLKVVLLMLRNMCEGQCTGMQHILREQPGHISNHNFVSLALDVLRLMLSDISDQSLIIGTQASSFVYI